MGYMIIIGELAVEKNPDDGLDSECIRFWAKPEYFVGAPAFGEPTDYTNQRWPSYSSWANALKEAGMDDIFFYNGGHLIGGHPGVRLVTQELCDEVAKRKLAFEKKYPNVEATYGNATLDQVDESNPSENRTYCRIVWLDYWLQWALNNCKTPVIANQ